jgi:peptide/nickel transport system permease protein
MRLGYILRRLGFLVGVMWTAATLNFVLPHLAPRDPIREQITQKVATMGLTAEGVAEQIASYKKLFGLDRPLWQQYVDYLWRMLHFDLGYSIVNYPKTVNELIAQSVWWTIGIVGTATILAFLVGTILGALLGWGKSRVFSSLVIPPLMIFAASPAFVIALVMIYFLAFRAKLFPLGRPYGIFTTVDWSSPKFLLEVVYHAVLPALSLIVVSAGGWGLGMRAMMVTVEVYFQYPGLGNRLAGAIASLDYFVVSGIVFFLVAGIALATFLVDMVYPLLDPRISYQRGT